MRFNEKLEFLMKITNTSNSALAKSCSLDPSFVSRLRHGKRKPSRKENYLKAMAIYFSRNSQATYQKETIYKTLNLQEKQTEEELSELLYKWLQEQESENTIQDFLNQVTHFHFRRPTVEIELGEADLSQNVFYGTQGKRDAVTNFLLLTLSSDQSQTLLLYSDEDLEWLTGDPNFTQKWSTLLAQVIMKGNRIKIIHTVNRNLDQMLSAIREWLPIYMTGAIEPYHYPKVRDGVFRRTLFIAPNTVALTSNSVGNNPTNTVNFLYTDKQILKAMTEEFRSFLSLCRPLMQIFTPNTRDAWLTTLIEFENEAGTSILRSNNLSNITIPLSVAERILPDTKDRENLLAFQESRIRNFKNRLKNQQHIEFITLPEVDEIQSGNVLINFSDILNTDPIYYTKEQFREHLENVLYLTETYENYHIYIENQEATNYMLYIKEDIGIIAAKTSIPSIIFAINESNMTAAFWNYLQTISTGEKKSLSLIRSLIKELR